MKLPTRLEDILRSDNGLASIVLRTLTVIEPWARDNKTVFFPEYTDHSLVHLAEVLATADSLISDQTWQHLTPEDAAVAVLATLLHDSALHLSEDGFYALINGRYEPKKSRYAKSDTPWPTLWAEYLAEARRFDQRKLLALFGNSDPIRTIPMEKADLTLKHRLLIGEFLRRHHARLAHEIALTGIPNQGLPASIGDGIREDLFDLAGYVARSHNINIRSAIDGIELSKRRVHLNCHVPFVMVVLRISDYLQIHSARAPGELMRLKTLISPISRGEWTKHQSVKEINQAHDDPESIFVDCDPETAYAFVAVRALLRDIQSELDQCWAALGEVYGRLTPLDKLGITIRRIRTNIDNPDQYRLARQPTYIPREFRFRTSSAELMDLLVAPLYGDKPEIGIRELVQNAVDACLERDDLERSHLGQFREPLADDIVVTLRVPDDGSPTLTVEDFGVGMTEDIVEQYFLNIGASFRSSDLWRRDHEVDGHSTIHRTGRFGIGLLAAFLLGKEVRVTTRHIHSTEECGLSFSCKQGADVIEVRPCSFHSGTRIDIDLTPGVAEILIRHQTDWDWYCLETPRVHRILIRDTERTLTQCLNVPECDSDLTSSTWRRILASGYDDIIWTYEDMCRDQGYSRRALICNGIFITASLYSIKPRISPGLNVLSADPPSLVVFDPDGRFPINLQRNEVLRDNLPFERELSLDISDFFASRMIQVFEGGTPGLDLESVTKTVDPRIPGLNEREYSSARQAIVLLTKSGVVPADLDLLKEMQPCCVLVDAVNIAGKSGSFTCPAIKQTGLPYWAVDGITQTKNSRTHFLRNSLGYFGDHGEPQGYFASLKIIGRRLLVRKKDVQELVSPGNVPKTLWNRLHLDYEGENYGLWSVGACPKLEFDLKVIDRELGNVGAFGFTMLYFDWTEDDAVEREELTAFSEAWHRYVDGPVLVQRMLRKSS